MTKGSVHQEEIKIINIYIYIYIYVYIRALKYRKQTLTELKGEKGSSTKIERSFNTPPFHNV